LGTGVGMGSAAQKVGPEPYAPFLVVGYNGDVEVAGLTIAHLPGGGTLDLQQPVGDH